MQPLHYQSKMKSKRTRFCLDDFELQSTLGTGTFGRVRLVKLKGNDNMPPFALKILKKTVVLKLKQLEHIRSEKAILERIRHPFIIVMLATFQDKGFLYMLLEYICGGELFSRLRREGRFANDVALFYACEIVLTFEYLHGCDIAYRDLKPENILIDKTGHIKLTDFGFAKYITDKSYTLCGTPEYLAPEIIQNLGHHKAVDWWALGILIYEMIAGFPPFYDEEPMGIYQKILSGRIEFSRVFNPRVKDLLKKLLQANVSKRYGARAAGVDDIKKHRWFTGVDWNSVRRREIPAPWAPEIKGMDDTHFFDNYPDSVEPTQPPPAELEALFSDF